MACSVRKVVDVGLLLQVEVGASSREATIPRLVVVAEDCRFEVLGLRSPKTSRRYSDGNAAFPLTKVNNQRIIPRLVVPTCIGSRQQQILA